MCVKTDTKTESETATEVSLNGYIATWIVNAYIFSFKGVYSP
jgi:hypothetical protein